MKNVIEDAIDLANNILKTLSSKKDLVIVNIAINKPNTFIVEGYPKIPLPLELFSPILKKPTIWQAVHQEQLPRQPTGQ